MIKVQCLRKYSDKSVTQVSGTRVRALRNCCLTRGALLLVAFWPVLFGFPTTRNRQWVRTWSEFVSAEFEPFGFFRRKHHCRTCGGDTVCEECSVHKDSNGGRQCTNCNKQRAHSNLLPQWWTIDCVKVILLQWTLGTLMKCGASLSCGCDCRCYRPLQSSCRKYHC